MTSNIEIFVLCNISAMSIEIIETYDDMIGLRQLLYMCEQSHLNGRIKIRGLCVYEQMQTFYIR